MFKILEFLNKNNYDAYFVGGFVRDHLWNIKNHDLDITSNADANFIKENFEVLKMHEEYGYYQIKYDNYIYELTLMREDLIYFEDRKVIIKLTNDLIKDAKRRDFYINALYMDKDKNIIDPLEKGLNDIKKKQINFINDYQKSIKQDPVRILRYCKYIVKYKLNYEKEVLKYVIDNLKMLENIKNPKIIDKYKNYLDEIKEMF